MTRDGTRSRGCGAVAYNPEIGEVRWTRQLYRQLGYGPDEVTPSLSAFRERVHPDDQLRLDEVREKEQKAAPGTQFQCEFRLVRPSENSCWIDRRSRLVEHEGRRQVIGVNVDVTERKKQEDNSRFIMNELSHRTKNLLSVVRAMASQTARYKVEGRGAGEATQLAACVPWHPFPAAANATAQP